VCNDIPQQPNFPLIPFLLVRFDFLDFVPCRKIPLSDDRFGLLLVVLPVLFSTSGALLETFCQKTKPTNTMGETNADKNVPC
jgi:hypothetical protein